MHKTSNSDLSNIVSHDSDSKASISFISKMVHELRNHVHGVKGISSFLCNNWNNIDENKKLESVRYIANSSTKLNELINYMLHLSITTVDKIKFHFINADLLSILRNIVEDYQSSLNIQNIKTKILIENDAPTYIVNIDIFWIKQMLTNLLDNAIRYSNGKDVYVQMKIISKFNNEKYLLCSVIDQGPGISEEELDYIFMPFRRNSEKKQNDNIGGIGLAVCREIIEAHYGQINAINNEYSGAKISFTLPLKYLL